MSLDVRNEIALLVQSGWRAIALETFEEARALRVLEQIARAAERGFHSWTAAAGLSGSARGAGSLAEGLKAIAELRDPAIFALLDGHALLSEPHALRRLRDLLPTLSERSQALVFVGPVIEIPLELKREVSFVELPLPRREELEALFRRQAEGADEADLQRAVVASLGLTASEATRVLRKACLASGGSLNQKAIDQIVREKRQALRRTPALEFCDAVPHLGEVGGLGELKRWLRDRRRAFSSEARQYGLPVPRGLLLLGVQGCGKSLCAKAVSREWQFPLLRLDLAEAFGRRDRSPEATVREATAVAESLAPVVLWIDEIEKGFAASRDGSSGRVFGSFLTWLAEKQAPVFVVATANDIEALPPELLRRGRFDDLFFVDLPNQTERMEILSIHLRKRGRDPVQFPLEDLANESARLSGAELEQVVASALYKSFAEDRDLNENDLINAITETVPLYDTYEKRIKELRDWARNRARPATLDAKVANLFG